MKIYIQLILIVFAFLVSCIGKREDNDKSSTAYRSYKGELIRPVAAEIELDSPLLMNQFDESNTEILKRYIAGNPRWEIRKEKKFNQSTELTYAIRKEEYNGSYETTLNGYYSDFYASSGIYQTRVMISFGDYYGHGNDTTHVTYARPKDKKIKTIIEAEHSGAPGNSSYLILQGNSINIEIFEQAKNLERKFTMESIKELNTELAMVLTNLDEIESTGVSPIKKFYPSKLDSTYFDIEDGLQPGIYLVKAGLSLNTEGYVYVKAFNADTNEPLSADRIASRTMREIGWSKDGKSIFPYESELTVYEGDWSHKYRARFEIWFRQSDGIEIKLAEKERIINGWER